MCATALNSSTMKASSFLALTKLGLWLSAGEALRDHGPKFWTAPEWRMWVTDEGGGTVCALSFSGKVGVRYLRQSAGNAN